MDCSENKVEEKPMRQMSLEEADGLDWSIIGKRPKWMIFRYVLEV